MITESLRESLKHSPEVMLDAEHFFDGYKADRGLCAGLPRRGAGGRCQLGRALRHQWRDAAARGRAHRQGRRPPRAAREARHPHPQRHRERRRQHAAGDPRGGAAGPGHAERPGRALRQRQSGLADPDPEAEARLRCRHRRRGGGPADRVEPRLRRALEPHAGPGCRLCRRQRLRAQGRAARLGGRQGSGLLRAHRPGAGRQCPRYPGLRPGRPRQSPAAACRHGPRRAAEPGGGGRASGHHQGAGVARLQL